MNEAIKNICIAIKEEADAIISYTDKMVSTSHEKGAESTTMLFETTRLDELEHIQNLVVELTKVMVGSSGGEDEATAKETKESEVLHGAKA